MCLHAGLLEKNVSALVLAKAYGVKGRLLFLQLKFHFSVRRVNQQNLHVLRLAVQKLSQMFLKGKACCQAHEDLMFFLRA